MGESYHFGGGGGYHNFLQIGIPMAYFSTCFVCSPGMQSQKTEPKVFALQILQRYLTKQGRIQKFFHC